METLFVDCTELCQENLNYGHAIMFTLELTLVKRMFLSFITNELHTRFIPSVINLRGISIFVLSRTLLAKIFL